MNVTLETIICPICGKMVYTHDATPIASRASVSSRDYAAASGMLTAMMLAAEAEHQKMLAAAEKAANEHFRTEHAWRLWLWRKLTWDRIMNRRYILFGQRYDYDQFSVHP